MEGRTARVSLPPIQQQQPGKRGGLPFDIQWPFSIKMKDNGVDALKVIRGDLLEKKVCDFFGWNKQQHGRVSIHMIRPSILQPEREKKSWKKAF